MNTRDTIHSQLEHLQMKYVGTGHADTTKFEWGSNIQRDTLASFIAHHPMLTYFSMAQNQATGRTKYALLDKMLAPVGPPPVTGEDEEVGSDDDD